MPSSGSVITFLGPVTAGGIVEPVCMPSFDLAASGYVQEEFFVSGTACCYRQVGAAGNDGRWTAQVAGSAPFRTRIIVRRPAGHGRFSGTLLLEWLNVTSGFEADLEWAYLHEEIVRGRHAYAAVSAQLLGVHGGEGILGFSGPFPGLRGSSPERYDTLALPGDQYSFDIFRQIGLALGPPRSDTARPGEHAADADDARGRGDVVEGFAVALPPRVLGGLAPARVLALGQSQSAYYLTSYINAVHPLDPIFDGFLVHSRGAGIAPLTGARIDPRGDVDGVLIRTDNAAPVLVLQAEGDLVRPLSSALARQPDSDGFRLWEVAGTAHTDDYVIGPAAKMLGCDWEINSGPHRYVAQAALRALHEWVKEGTPPPRAARIELASPRPPVIKRDSAGNAVGGVRTPAVDVPVAVLSGEGPPGVGAGLGWLVGSTVGFDAAELVRRYRDQVGYLRAYAEALDAAIGAGFLLSAHAEQLLAEAAAVSLPA